MSISISDQSTLVDSDPWRISENGFKGLRCVIVGIAGGKKDPHCLISIQSLIRNNRDDLINDRVKKRYTVSKSYSDLLQLDTCLRSQGYNGEPLLSKRAFNQMAPTKLYMRKVLLEIYFQNVLNNQNQLKDSSVLFEFLDRQPTEAKKFASSQFEGYLVEKTDSLIFEKWKSFYFVLKNNALCYYSQKGGEYKGTINLDRALIFAQSEERSGVSNGYHGILVIESLGRKIVRHSLCANNDKEKQAWVKKLIESSEAVTTTPLTTNDILKRLQSRQSYNYES
ncbi:hypothetical protein BY458DRAFT_512955 [Sporodiniella umbellata]|nr:hypothetical protein BY458DRAFT_512955 [Sporodiniella umbellata]